MTINKETRRVAARLQARCPVGQLITDRQKRTARSTAEVRAIATKLAREDAAVEEFLATLSASDRAEMERDCAA